MVSVCALLPNVLKVFILRSQQRTYTQQQQQHIENVGTECVQ